ncbi:MAG: DUF1992 domain-containing protein [Chloroflexi bacterium]|nr:MAG: DUF1992 domain-containing protein [Chloroflexota bacterium]MBL1195397.1 DUF1992 domain-containing protein [Chloroflexota bacterium]NOH12680.1 DUF1992 domain-containing protein [Chloroflexota bacterium]
MSKRSRGVDEQVRKAMEEGKFDNLPGKGQPIQLENNPFVDPEWALAHDMLKKGGYAPEFIERREAIEMELAQARELLARSWQWKQRAIEDGEEKDMVAAEWGRVERNFRERIEEINKKIFDYNLVIPADIFYRELVNLDGELKRIQVHGK